MKFIKANLARCCTVMYLTTYAAVTPATTHLWPSLPSEHPGCATTLQACIDQAEPGDTVSIGPPTALDFAELRYFESNPVGAPRIRFVERFYNRSPTTIQIVQDIVIRKALTLRAQEGITAYFFGSAIRIEPPATNVMLDHLNLGVGSRGGIEITEDSLKADASFRLTNLNIHGIGARNPCAITVRSNGSTATRVVMASSRFGFDQAHFHGVVGGLCITKTNPNGKIHAEIFRNRFLTDNDGNQASTGWAKGIVIDAGAAGGTIAIVQNQFSGQPFLSGIEIGHDRGSPSAFLVAEISDNLVTGQRNYLVNRDPDTPDSILRGAGIYINAGNTNLSLRHNTVAHNENGLIVNMQLRDGGGYVSVPRSQVFGTVANNIVAANQNLGMAIPAGMNNQYNLVHGNRIDEVAYPGPGTITRDPRFIGDADFRLQPDSPAVDAGNPWQRANVWDAGGAPRYLFHSVDMGAFEYDGGQAWVHTATFANTPNHISILDEVSSPPASGHLLVTPRRPDLPLQNLGVYYLWDNRAGRAFWSLFDQAGTRITPSHTFNVMVAGSGVDHFTHLTNEANVSAHATVLDDVRTNNHPEAMLFVMPNWNSSIRSYPHAGYHNHLPAVTYDAASSRWNIINTDGADMPPGIAFNVVLAPAYSNNAFYVETGDVPTDSIALRHPLLDDNPCAAAFVTQRLSAFESARIHGTLYSLRHSSVAEEPSSHWYLQARQTPAFAPHTGFNVMVDGGQALSCGS